MIACFVPDYFVTFAAVQQCYSMKIGTIEFNHTPLFLAPMEDVTYKSFRWMCKKFGADVMYTEFVSSDGLNVWMRTSEIIMMMQTNRITSSDV